MNRRKFIQMCMVGGIPSAFTPKAARASSSTEILSFPPFTPTSRDKFWGSTKKVFVRWNFFPTSLDNLRPANGYYTREYIHPGSEGGKYSEGEGYIQERSLLRPPSSSARWRLDDMVDEIDLASNIGIDAFQVNIWSVTNDRASWLLLKRMLDARIQFSTRSCQHCNLE